MIPHNNRLLIMMKIFGTILFLVNISICAQTQKINILKAGNNEVYPQKKLVILWDNVILEHNGNVMYCDSAVVYKSDNSFLAFKKILIDDKESIKLSGDSLKYYGDSQKANIRGNVTLYSKEIDLKAPSLDYDLKNKIAFYNQTADIKNKNTGNRIKSIKGNFNTINNTFFFKDSVELINIDYTLKSDTLVYNTVSEISEINGKTRIITKASEINCHKGWFDSKKNISSLIDSVFIKSKTHTLSADSLFYDENTGQAEAYGNVVLIDDTSHWEIIGNQGFYDEKIDSASIYGNSTLTQIEKEDTLKIVAEKFITKREENYYELFCFNKVNLFGNQIKGKCDSLYYNEIDSLMHLFKEPILWIDESQITGNLINFKIKNGKVFNMEIMDNSFIITQKDSIHFDQIKGDYVKGFFIKNHIKTMNIIGNGKVIYFSENEKNKNITDVNNVECEKMKIKFTEKNIKEVIFQSETSGNSAAILAEKKYKLEGFKIHEKISFPKGE
ncbi:MAG: hypothetical protein CL846_01630 [Crocinitomicaceae bacterium]|nr:hypothetical protein [Crocinitomicaceae bacterium]|tara:strand:- start:4711 stop:6210 length:1500 start_codon:yes stop_codon:yes gene_type:complete